jgi:hypothetical protein
MRGQRRLAAVLAGASPIGGGAGSSGARLAALLPQSGRSTRSRRPGEERVWLSSSPGLSRGASRPGSGSRAQFRGHAGLLRRLRRQLRAPRHLRPAGSGPGPGAVRRRPARTSVSTGRRIRTRVPTGRTRVRPAPEGCHVPGGSRCGSVRGGRAAGVHDRARAGTPQGPRRRASRGAWLVLTAFRTLRDAEEFVELSRSAGYPVSVLRVRKLGGPYVGLGQEAHLDGVSGPLLAPLPDQESFQE